MNLNHTVKVVGSVILSAVMAGSMMPIYATETTTDDNPTEKQETVYAVLNSDGSMSDTIVSSWLHDEDGINNIKETLNLKNVKNIKTDEEPSKSGNTYTWNADGNDVYYQGNATQTLPVTLKIKYELDGKEMSSSDMEGKSGHLKLTITFTNNQSETKTINGKSIVIHPSYLAGGIINMNTGNYTNVKCEQGKIVNDGSNEILAFANIPGLNETLESAGLSEVSDKLGISDTVSVEADVEDFDLGSIMIGMTNEIDLEEELGSIDSVSELTSGMDELMSAEEQLVDGSKQLYDGTTELKEEASPLTSSSGQVRTLASGVIQLNDGVKKLQTGVSSYTSGVSALDAGVAQLYAIPTGAGQIKAGMTTSTKDETGEDQPSLVDGTKALTAGLGKMLDTLNSTDVTKTVSGMSTMLTEAKTALQGKDGKGGLVGTLAKDKTTLETMQDQLKNAKEQISGLTTLKEQLATLSQSIVDKEDQNNNAVAKDNEKIGEVNNQINTIKSSLISSIDASITALTTAKENAESVDDQNAIQTQIEALNTQKTVVNNVSTIESLETLQTLTDEFTKLNSALTTIDSTVSSMDTLVSDSLKAIGDAESGLTKDVNDSLATIDALETKLSGATTTITSMQTLLGELKAGVTELYNGAVKIQGGTETVVESIGSLQTQSQNGIDQVKAGTSKLTSNNDTLNSGLSTVSDATGTLAGQSDTFTEMADGLDTLAEAFETLNSGAQELYEGQTQFKSEGLDQLQEKVNLGVDELNTLESVLDEIKAMNKKYSSYSGAPEGATVTTRYVFRTKEDE